jgi:cytochrome P450
MYKALIGWDNGREVAGLETVMDEKLHTMLRRPVASYFTLDSAVRLEPLIDECGENFMFHLRRLGTFDMTQWFRYFSIDTINKIAFSEDLGFMNSGKDVGGTLAALELGFRAWASVATFPQAAMWLRWALSCISAIPLPLVDMASSRVKARCQLERTAGSKVDLLDHYLEASRQYPDVYTQERVVGLTLTTIFAGSETTGVTLINSIYGLLKHPDALAHVQDELHRAAQLGDLSYPPQWKELSKLPYLDATIKEGMRTVGLLRLSLDRTVPGEGIELCGQVIPAGTIVGCLPQVIHHNKGVYGPDAEEFRPSRWLEADEEKRKTMERAAMWFGQGKHICLGQHIARVEMMKILAMLFMRFQVNHIHEHRPKRGPLWSKDGLIFNFLRLQIL